jgi:hypothetical protein
VPLPRRTGALSLPTLQPALVPSHLRSPRASRVPSATSNPFLPAERGSLRMTLLRGTYSVDAILRGGVVGSCGFLPDGTGVPPLMGSRHAFGNHSSELLILAGLPRPGLGSVRSIEQGFDPGAGRGLSSPVCRLGDRASQSLQRVLPHCPASRTVWGRSCSRSPIGGCRGMS